MADEITLKVSDLVGGLRVTLRVSHDMRLRMWLGSRIVGFGCWLIGCVYVVQVRSQDE